MWKSVPRDIAMEILHHLMTRLPPGVDPEIVMDTICCQFRRHAKKWEVADDEAARDILATFAKIQLVNHYLAWRAREKREKEVVTWLTHGFVNNLDFSKTKHVDRNFDIWNALNVMGEKSAEALFLREWTGLTSQSEAQQRHCPDCGPQRHRAGGVPPPRAQLRWWLCRKCTGYTGFTDQEIARAVGVAPGEVRGLLKQARRVLGAHLNGTGPAR